MSKVHGRVDTPFEAQLDDEDTAALRAFMNASANAEQQKIARDVILGKICRVNDLGYFDREDHRNIAMGKRWVGQRMLQALIYVPKQEPK